MQKGDTHTEQSKKKMSEAKSGENHPLYGVRGEEHPNFGKTHNEITKQKISKTNSIKVRGIKLIKDKRSIKANYDEILNLLQNGWEFKSKHIMINNGTNKQRIIPVHRFEEFFPNKNWFFGSLPQNHNDDNDEEI